MLFYNFFINKFSLGYLDYFHDIESAQASGTVQIKIVYKYIQNLDGFFFVYEIF